MYRIWCSEPAEEELLAQAGLGAGGQPSSTVGQGTGSLGAWHPPGACSAREGQTDSTGRARHLPSAVPEGRAGRGAGGGGEAGREERLGPAGWHRHAQICAGPHSLLTFCLAHVVRLHEVLGAAADVGSLGVVAELGAGPKAQALVDVWAVGDRSQGGDQEGAPMHTARASPSLGAGLHYLRLGDPVSPHSSRLCPKDTISDAPGTPQA